MLRRSDRTVLFIIFLIAFIFRSAGASHDFPFIFHPDEPTIIRSALGIRFNSNPAHFDWPHLYIYLNYFLYMAFAYFRDFVSNLGLRQLFEGVFSIMWQDNIVFYYITRLLTAFLGALTIVPVYLTGKNIFNNKVGLLSALTMAALPFHVWHAHYALSDTAMVLLVACTMYVASQILMRNSVSDYAGAGLYAGLAASTKYNGGLSAVMVPLAHLLRIIKSPDEELIDLKGILNLVISGIFAIIGFIIGTPFAFLDYKTFLRTDGPKGALWQFTNVGAVPMNNRIPEFFHEMVFRVADDLGYIVLGVFFFILVLVFVKLILRKSNETDINLLFLLLPTLFYLFYTSGFAHSRSHYYMIAYPAMAVIFGYFVATVYEIIERKSNRLSFLAILFLFIPIFYFSFVNTVRFVNGDTRSILHTWLQLNNKQNLTVVYNVRNLDTVLKTKQYNSKRGFGEVNYLNAGYAVLSYDHIVPEAREMNAYLKVSGRLEKVFEIKNSYFLGPNIEIFQINND